MRALSLAIVKTLLRFSLLLLSTAFLTGCGGNFLIGKWELDRETTIAHLTNGKPKADNPGEGFLKELVNGLQKGVSHLLLAQFEGEEIEFTATEMRRIRNGVGEATGYRIIERPASGTVVIQYENDEIMTWSRSDSGIRMRLPGEEEHWVYFKRFVKAGK